MVNKPPIKLMKDANTENPDSTMQFNSIFEYVLIICFALLSLSCDPLPNPPGPPNNPLDPANPDYLTSGIRIDGGPANGAILTSGDSIQFRWSVNMDGMKFRHKLNDGLWSELTDATSVLYVWLADDDYRFCVSGRTKSGVESDTVRRQFSIDAIHDATLSLVPQNIVRNMAENFQLDLRADEIDSVMGISATIDFDTSAVRADSVRVADDTSAALFVRHEGQSIYFNDIDSTNGQIVIDCALAEADADKTDGNGIIATLYFTALNPDTTIITIAPATKVRDGHNQPLDVTQLLSAKIIIRHLDE
jgi:hypothetical protein